jgi:putative ABC transport system permease protein
MSGRTIRLIPGLAVAAVVAPLLVLQGLKHGTITTLRDRLVQDPVFRELRPSSTREYEPDWFRRLATDPRVGFLLPTILPASSILGVIHPHSGRQQNLDLVPTAEGDALVLDNGGQIPGEGECVLTAAAAAALDVRIGDILEVRATRSRGGVAEYGAAELRVAAVLDARAGTLSRIYAPLQFVLDVESYKEGYAVSARGWTGDVAHPSPTYDAVLVLVDRALDSIEQSGLAVNTGLGGTEELTPEAVRSKLALAPPDGWYGYVLTAPGGARAWVKRASWLYSTSCGEKEPS